VRLDNYYSYRGGQGQPDDHLRCGAHADSRRHWDGDSHGEFGAASDVQLADTDDLHGIGIDGWFLQRLTGYRSEPEALKSQAAMGV